MDEYRKYNEKPTLLWVAVIMIFSAISLAAAVFLNTNITFSLILFAVGITTASIGITIFLMTVVYPIVADWFSKPRKYEDD